MSGFNGSGTFQISAVGLPYVSGTVISSAVANQLNTDLATGLSTCILKDGTQSVTANIPFNNHNINNISAVGIGTSTPTYPLHIKSGATDLFYVNSSGALTVASTIDSGSITSTGTISGTTITSTGAASSTSTNTASAFIPTGSTAPSNGMYLSAANTLAFATNSAIKFSLDSSGNSTTTGTDTSAAFIPTSSTVPTNGMYLSAANTLAFATNSTNALTISSSGVLSSSSGTINTTTISATGSITASTSITGSTIVPTSSTPATIGMYKPGSTNLGFSTANTCRLVVGNNTFTSTNGTSGTGSTSMTTGFFYIPAAAGIPTGTPTAITGAVPMYYDTTNNNFYVYNGAWKKVALT